jgi:hypothetical protein
MIFHRAFFFSPLFYNFRAFLASVESVTLQMAWLVGPGVLTPESCHSICRDMGFVVFSCRC